LQGKSSNLLRVGDVRAREPADVIVISSAEIAELRTLMVNDEVANIARVLTCVPRNRRERPSMCIASIFSPVLPYLGYHLVVSIISWT
jgi:Tfp pilus assembly ATPase PilU